MNEKKLYKALGHIEEDFIMEAKDSSKKVKKLHFKKIATIAIAATMMLGIGTWAASSVITSRISGTSSSPDFKTLPSSTQINEILGVEISLPEEFSNGYKFENAHKVENQNQGENNAVVESFDSLSTNYTKADDNLIFSIDPLTIGNQTPDGDLVDTYNNCDIYYGSYTAKFVPADYQLTEQDKADEASGKYVFSYGSSEIIINEIQGLQWKDDGVFYSFTTMDSTLTQEELVSMANEMIDMQ